MYSRETINELNQLSKDVYGASSKWRKLVERGEVRLLTEEEVQYDSEANNGEGERKNITVPVIYHGPNGGKLRQSYMHRYDEKTVKEHMLNIKDQRDKFMEMIKKQQADAQAADVAKKVEEANAAVAEAVSAVSGSAV